MSLTLAQIIPLILLMLGTGIVAGLLAGLLGVGGGIVIVPILFLILDGLNFPDSTAMHIAVASSLATIIPTSIQSARAHHRRGNVDFELFRRWAPALVIGACTGGLLSFVLDGGALKLVFGVIGLLVAINMASPRKLVLGEHLPLSPLVQRAMAGVIGLLSALMGIGGGTLSVPTLSLYAYPTHRAVGTASAFGLLIALPAILGYIWSGWAVADRPPWSIGYVNLLAVIAIIPMTMLFAPIGARLAHALRAEHLRLVFALFLALTAGRMLWSTL